MWAIYIIIFIYYACYVLIHRDRVVSAKLDVLDYFMLNFLFDFKHVYFSRDLIINHFSISHLILFCPERDVLFLWCNLITRYGYYQ